MPGQLTVVIWMCFITFLAVKIMGNKRLSFIERLDTRKKNPLDALRCFLAIAVAFHHLMFNYFYATEGLWQIDGYSVNLFLGRFGVFMFFMLSGFLFSEIEIKNIKWWSSFYIKRIFRIAPMCFVSALACVLISYIYGNDKTIHVQDLIKWFDAGVVNHRPDLFGLKDSELINSGVTWTLRREWVLYFSLPLITLAIPNRKRKSIAALVAVVTFIWLVVFKTDKLEQNTQHLLNIFFFAVGFLSKHLKSKSVIKLATNTKYQILLLILLCITAAEGKYGAAPGILLIAILFIFICNGFTLFGLLESKGAIRLGEISYSLYLIHGVVWYLLFKEYPNDTFILLKSSIAFFIIIALSIFFYTKVEKPIYNLIKRKGKRNNSNNEVNTI